MEELVKEFYSKAWFTGVELKCWVHGKDFVITLDYLAEILQMNHLVNVDIFPYNDRLTPIVQILETFGAELEVSSMGTSIGTSRFKVEIKTLTLIMYSNLYPLINTGFISHGRAQFLCDLINRVPIDICAYFFHISRQTARQSATRTCLPFCSLIMKIITL